MNPAANITNIMHNVISALSLNGGSTRLLKILVEKSLYGMGKKRTQDADWELDARKQQWSICDENVMTKLPLIEIKSYAKINDPKDLG